MADENNSLDNLSPENDGQPVSPRPLEDETAPAAPESAPVPPSRPEYTKKQRVLALLGAIFVILVTLMYTYSIATGDLFFR